MESEAPTVFYVYDIICGWCHIARPAIEKVLANLQGLVKTDVVNARFYASERAVTINQATIDHVRDVDRERGPKLTGQRYSEAYLKLISAPGYLHDSHVTSLACATVELTAPDLLGRYREQLQNKVFLEGEDPKNPKLAVSIASRLGLEAQKFEKKLNDPTVFQYALERAELAEELLSFSKAQGIPQLFLVHEKRLVVLDPYSPNETIQAIKRRMNFE